MIFVLLGWILSMLVALGVSGMGILYTLFCNVGGAAGKKEYVSGILVSLFGVFLLIISWQNKPFDFTLKVVPTTVEVEK